MRVLLVGEMPAKDGDYRRPLEGRVGRRLAKLMGITLDEYLEKFERVNVIEKRIEPFPSRLATKRAALIKLGRYQNVVLLGRNSSEAFSLDFSLALFRWTLYRGAWFATIPHPSGLNRWWNDEGNVRRAERFLRALV